MKKSLCLLFLPAIILYFSCTKREVNVERLPENKSDLVASSLHYLKESLQTSEYQKLDLNSVQVISGDNSAGVVRVFTVNKSENKFAVVSISKKGKSGNWVSLPHGSLANDSKKGEIITESFDKTFKSHAYYIKNEVVKLTTTSNGKVKVRNIRPKIGVIENKNSTMLSTPTMSVQSNCDSQGGGWLPSVTFTHYVNNNAFNFFSVYWFFSQADNFTTTYTDIPPTYNANGDLVYATAPDQGSTVDLPVFVGPGHPVVLSEELKCFTETPGATYRLSLNLYEPNPGTGTIVNPWRSNAKVGHAYISFEQLNPDGSYVSRNVGFYPANSATPASRTDQGAFGDDTQTPYTVSLTIDVSSTEFQTAKQTLMNSTTQNYNMDSYNCTNVATGVFSAINVSLPNGTGTIYGASGPPTWQAIPLFQGQNPGTLGQAVRELNANDFSAANGNRAVTIRRSMGALYKARDGNCN